MIMRGRKAPLRKFFVLFMEKVFPRLRATVIITLAKTPREVMLMGLKFSGLDFNRFLKSFFSQCARRSKSGKIAQSRIRETQRDFQLE